MLQPRGRLGGTFGNAAYLASYLGMTSFITFAIAKDYFSWFRKAIYSSGILQIIVIFLTATRGTILAFLVVGFLALIYFSFNKKESKLKVYLRGILILSIMFASLFFVFREQLKESSFEPVRRIASISLTEGTVANRLFVWQAVLGEANKKPFSGYGAEQVGTLFNKNYDPSLVSEQWFDRSHNVFLDYFAQYGIFGLLLYLLIILTLLKTSWKAWQSGDEKGLYILGLTLVYSIQNFFVFDTAITLWLLFVLTASSLSISREDILPISLKNPQPVVGLISALVITSLVLPIIILPIRANLLLMKGYLDHMVDVPKSVSDMEKGLSLNTYADLEYGYQAYVMYTERQAHELVGEDRIKAYNYSYNLLKENFEKYPDSVRTATYLAHVIDLAPPEVERDNRIFNQVLSKAFGLSEKRTQLWLLRANIFLREADKLTGQEKIDAYIKSAGVVEEYTKLVPKNAESRYILANLYLKNIEDKQTAKMWAEEGFGLYKGKGETSNRAFQYYIAIEDWEKSLIFLKDMVEDNKQDYALKYDLAKLYYLTGNQEKSVELFDQVQKEKPEILQTDPNFLQTIQGL
ncbi:O-antigen ligase family protein [Patescibacteria group bacterium]